MCGGAYWTYADWPNSVQSPYSGPSPDLSGSGYKYVDYPQYSELRAVATTTQLSGSWPQGVPGPARANGVSFAMSMTGARDVTDGLSNTFLLGEKNIDSDHYLDGLQAGDCLFALQGFDFGIYRFANDYSNCASCTPYDVPGPHPDTPGYEFAQSFGSAHDLGFDMALCDGSVRMINYTIDLTTYSHLCNRCDGQKIDAKQFRVSRKGGRGFGRRRMCGPKRLTAGFRGFTLVETPGRDCDHRHSGGAAAAGGAGGAGGRARMAQCRNNLKQLSLGCLHCECANGFLPTGGWCFAWVGDPDRGQGKRQPGGWLFCILPYVEQNAIFKLGSGLPSSSKLTTNVQRMGLTFATMYCPTRRRPLSYPSPAQCCPWNAALCPPTEGRTDYVANLGDHNWVCDFDFNDYPTSLAAGNTFRNWLPGYTGTCYSGSEVKIRDITDGTSNTFLLGEKTIDADHYLDGKDAGDDWSWDTGQQDDIVCQVASYTANQYTYYPPIRDTPGANDYLGFGMCMPRG